MEKKEIEYITRMVIQSLNSANIIQSNNREVPVGVSARHIHLTQQDVDSLFGTGYQLTVKKELMGGQYACNETVAIVSHKMKILENIRIIGPVRKASQIELSLSDSFKLGMKVPLRNSGDIEGSAGVTILGPKGTVILKEGCIIPARHIHMTPLEAEKFGVVEGDIVSVEFLGERGVIFKNVAVRVDTSYRLEMHIDTDEANAALIKTGSSVTLLKR